MTFTEKDAENTQLARPVSVVDLWSLDDRIDRLESIEIKILEAAEKLEKITEKLVRLHAFELAKMNQSRRKRGTSGADRRADQAVAGIAYQDTRGVLCHRVHKIRTEDISKK